MSIFMLHQEICAEVLIARTIRMTFIECKRAIVSLLGSRLLSYQTLIVFIDLALIGRIDQIIVVLVTLTLFWVYTSISTFTKCGAFLTGEILFDV